MGETVCRPVGVRASSEGAARFFLCRPYRAPCRTLSPQGAYAPGYFSAAPLGFEPAPKERRDFFCAAPTGLPAGPFPLKGLTPLAIFLPPHWGSSQLRRSGEIFLCRPYRAPYRTLSPSRGLRPWLFFYRSVGARASSEGAVDNSPGRQPWVQVSKPSEPCKGDTPYQNQSHR